MVSIMFVGTSRGHQQAQKSSRGLDEVIIM